MSKSRVLSIIMPVYNEARTVKASVKAALKSGLKGIKKQLIIVDDGSTDGTTAILKKIAKSGGPVKVVFMEKNSGKGSAICEGVKHIKGDYTIIQDADLEYDPADYNILLDPLLRGDADVVFGSRFLGTHRSFLFWHLIANKILTFMTNLLYNTTLTDMETCYKLFKSPVIQGMKLRSKGFEIEPELTAKVLKQKCRIYEVPIHFYGRGYSEGKKIKAIDGYKAMFALLWYRFFD
jgi:glycosyltransferase involved in cell wall biosynthesis